MKFGKEFSRDEINEAIRLKSQGGDPYSIVESKDEVGHGTTISSIAAARGKNPDVIGVAPNSELIVVKLKPEGEATLALSGVTKPNVLAYGTVNFMAAVRYVSILSSEMKRPIAIIVAMGSNLGPHDGSDILEGYLDNFSTQAGAVVVAGTGNEGDTETHVEGIIKNQGDEVDIEVMVDKGQNTLGFEVWINRPDIMSISVTSPSGEKIDRIPARLGKRENIKFIYEGTSMEIVYNLSNIATGDESIVVKALNLKPGIWRFTLYGDHIVNGNYYAWLPQRNLLYPDTRFLQPSIDTTLENPSSANRVLSVSYYNQNNDTVLSSSGRGYARNGRIKPEIAAGGINAKAVSISGIQTVSGSSVATSVVAGICALILQWAIVDGNDPNIFSTEIITYVIRGARMRKGDRYPNREWGYGLIDLTGIMNSIRGEFFNVRCSNSIYEEYKEYEIENVFYRIPNEFLDINLEKIKFDNFDNKEQI